MHKQLLNNKYIYIISFVATMLLMFIVYYFNVPNPNLVMIALIVYITFLGGFLSGVISGLLTIIYSTVFFSTSSKLLTYSQNNLKELVVCVIFVPLIVLIVGSLKDQFMRQTAELEALNHELSLMSMKDGLTGLFNRRYFDEFIRVEWIRAFRGKTPISFIFIDIDYFKDFNDTYGHLNGDDCLIDIANALVESDKRTGDLVARYGGDEFAVILPNTDSIGAKLVVQKIVQAVNHLQISHKSSPIYQYVTLSLGVATMIPSEGKSYYDLIKKADEALYLAKENGRNRAEVLVEEKNKKIGFPSFM